MIAWVLAAWAAAAEPDPVVDAIAAELARAEAELRLPNRPAPYYIACQLYEGSFASARATLGGIDNTSDGPFRWANVEVRVGSEDLDNSNFTSPGEPTGFTSTQFVLDESPWAIRHDLWLEIDRAYKGAVENLARKKAARADAVVNEAPPSFVPGEAPVAAVGGSQALDAEALRALARRLSAVFLEHPAIHDSRVEVEASAGRSVFLDTRGARVEQPVDDMAVRVIATVRAPDGRTATDDVSWYVVHQADLPPEDEMVREVEALATRLGAWRDVPPAEDAYVGPVLFEDAAAQALFRQLLVPALSGTPTPGHPESRWGPETARAADTARLKRRVLPPGWQVVDDPQGDPTLPSARRYDDEGQPGVRVSLVEDGVVRGLLMSRTPNDQLQGSNGHGRRSWDDIARAVPAQMSVTSDSALPRKKLVKRGLKLGVTYDLDHVLVVRRLADPTLAEQGRFFSFSFGAADESVPEGLTAPIEVVRVYADGREEPVTGLRFSGVDPRSLRDVVAAGPSTTATWLAQPYDEFGFGGDATSGFPATLTAPSVLISEMELVPADAEAEPPPLLPSPLAGE